MPQFPPRVAAPLSVATSMASGLLLFLSALSNEGAVEIFAAGDEGEGPPSFSS